MADSPWSSLRTRCWWYRLSSVVAVFVLASRLQARHWQSCGSQLWYRLSTFAYHMRLRAYCLSDVVRCNWIRRFLWLRLDVDIQHPVPWPADCVWWLQCTAAERWSSSEICAINQSVKSMTSASMSYFNRIVATLNTAWAFNIYIYKFPPK